MRAGVAGRKSRDFEKKIRQTREAKEKREGGGKREKKKRKQEKINQNKYLTYMQQTSLPKSDFFIFSHVRSYPSAPSFGGSITITAVAPSHSHNLILRGCPSCSLISCPPATSSRRPIIPSESIAGSSWQVVSSYGTLNGTPHQLNNHPPPTKKKKIPIAHSVFFAGRGGEVT